MFFPVGVNIFIVNLVEMMFGVVFVGVAVFFHGGIYMRSSLSFRGVIPGQPSGLQNVSHQVSGE